MDILKTLIFNLSDNEPLNILETGTIRSYHEKHESTRVIGESTTGKVTSIDISDESIKIAKDVCKHLNNIEWILGDSIDVMNQLNNNHDEYDLILLDSINDPDHIYEEFKLALKMVKIGGTIMIDDFGVGADGNIPDKTHPLAKKGTRVFEQVINSGFADSMRLYQSTKGVQCMFQNITQDLKNVNFN